MTTHGIDPDATANLAVRGILLALLDTMESKLTGVLQVRDPKALHDFRVALRRSRCALTRIKDVLPDSAVRRFERDLRWLGVRSGTSRDLDVYLLQMPVYQAALGPGAEHELAPLVDLLSRKRRQEYGRLTRTLGSRRFERFQADWRVFLQCPPGDPSSCENADRPVSEVASRSIARAFQRTLQRGSRLESSASAEALHKLRIDCKNLRYLMAFFSSLYPKAALQPLIKEVKRLQDHLGEVNDLVVQQRALEGFARDLSLTGNGPAPTLMALGRLMGQMEERLTLRQESFQERLRQFSRPLNRTRFQNLFGPTDLGTLGEVAPTKP